MIGYLIEQELGNLLPFEIPLATLLTMVEVDPADPAFRRPSKFVGPGYSKIDADRATREKEWTFRQDGDMWRRVVPSPRPQRIFEKRPIRWLLEMGSVVICAGGGGIPVMYLPGRERVLGGVEAVIDKDLASALLAKDVGADILVMATDVDGVYLDWNTPSSRVMRDTTPVELKAHTFAPGSMGPKVEAACQFVEETGKRAAIGALGDIPALVTGDAGTQVRSEQV
jgi:carbamate kinase